MNIKKVASEYADTLKRERIYDSGRMWSNKSECAILILMVLFMIIFEAPKTTFVS